MYCPNCNKEYGGKFCPECGTKLIEKPQVSGFNLNLGDANAINGGINFSDSHNVTNVDNSVHNTTNNVTNITNVAAQKTEFELKQERKSEFISIVNAALEDGVLDQEELNLIEKERLRLGIDSVTAKNILNAAKNNVSNANISALTPTQRIILNQIKQYIYENDFEHLSRQLTRLEGLANNSVEEDVKYLYYLSAAAIDPEKLIDDYENGISDNYWKSFWVYIAYTKKNNFKCAEDALKSLSLYSNYPKENTTLLSCVAAMREFGNDVANGFLETLEGNYSELLNTFVSSLYYQIDPQLAKNLGCNEKECLFYIQHTLHFEDDLAKAEREAAEFEKKQAEANKRYNLKLETVGSNSFKVSMALKSGLGISISEATALMGCCPVDVLQNVTLEQLNNLYENLKKAGAVVEYY